MCGCLLHAPYWGPGPATQACALTGNQTRDSLVHRPGLSPLSHTSKGTNAVFKNAVSKTVQIHLKLI